jgi:hypothetical protein
MTQTRSRPSCKRSNQIASTKVNQENSLYINAARKLHRGLTGKGVIDIYSREDVKILNS